MEAATQNAMHSEQLSRRNFASQRWGIVLLVLNFIGAVVYVVRASNGWVIPRERELGLHSVTGEPYIWAISVRLKFSQDSAPCLILVVFGKILFLLRLRQTTPLPSAVDAY